MRANWFTALSVFNLVLLLPLANLNAQSLDANAHVLEIAAAYTDGGGYILHPTKSQSGAPEEIDFKGTNILAYCPEGTYCSGFTFAVAMKAANDRHLLDDKSVDQIKKFRRTWFGTNTNKDGWEAQCALALEDLGIGKQVPYAEAKPGDFMQIYKSDESNDAAGHSVIFTGWEKDDQDKIIGISFRSSQKKTNGIGNAKAYFNDTVEPNALQTFGYKISRTRMFVGRLN